MVRIRFTEPSNAEWSAWKKDCARAKASLLKDVAEGKKVSIKRQIYSDQRMQRVYKSAGRPFYGKCAYCESDILLNQNGDIEHWRPKKQVRDEVGGIVMIQPNCGPRIRHPGYYWLAYDWRNLLFSCIKCNRLSGNQKSKDAYGKGEKFPVKDFRATKPGEESKEKPLLINPVIDDPENHLQIDPRTGLLIPKTDRGRASIDIFGLNKREALVSARFECIMTTRLRVYTLCGSSDEVPEMDKNHAREKIRRIRLGSAPYSAAGRAVIRAMAYDCKW